MPEITYSNQAVEQAATDLKAQLNDGIFYMRLYKNNFSPVPGDAAGAFTEADFDGYAAIDVTGTWGAITKIVNGLYEIAGAEFSFLGGTTANQTVYGWYIEGSGEWICGKAFPAPILVKAGLFVKVTVNPQTVSLSIL